MQRVNQRANEQARQQTWQRGLKVLAALLAVLFLLPPAAGLLGTLLPALGFAPQIAPGNGFALLFTDPRSWPAIRLSLFTGIVATALTFLLTLLTLVCAHNTRLWRWLMASLPPLLAVPHAAMAVGLAFLLAPSGWLTRLVSPWASGWQRPPDGWVIPDAGGWSLILALVLKEAPFLLLIATAQLGAINVNESVRIGRTLGYAPARCWSRLVLPRLYPRIRLTLMVILAYNLSVVDLAIILGPGNPPTFAVLLTSLVNDPGSRAAASAGALLLSAGVLLCFVALLLVERLIARLAHKRRDSGKRGTAHGSWRTAGQALVVVALVISLLSLLVLAIWSVARRWRFPAALPQTWEPSSWINRADLIVQPMLATLLFSLFTAAATLIAAVSWLELERGRHAPKLGWIWYLPLLVPQVSLLFGWQAAALFLRTDGWWITVAWAHWIYALPYAILILAVAWREFDSKWIDAARVLGAGYWRVLFRVRLPMMMVPLCQAAAVALAVSVAQYLPTLLLGGGRHQTLAIELVTSFAGVDRRVVSALALLQSLIPLIAFALALLIPELLRRRLRTAA